MVALDFTISAFIAFIGGTEVYYSLFALYFLVATGTVFYNISTH